MTRKALGLSPRNQLDKALSKGLVSMRPADVEDADRWVDEALTVLETEEPSMLEWFSGDEDVSRALDATSIAIFNAVHRGMMLGQPVDKILRWINFYNYRMACASAWNSANRERGTYEPRIDE